MPTLIFSMPINAGSAEGSTSLVSICRLPAPIEASSSILFLSVDKNPSSMCMVATMMLTSTVMNTMEGAPAPNQTMMTGPSAILGRALSTTMYGSKMRRARSLHHSSRAIAVPAMTATAKPASVSHRVVPMW